MKESVFHITKFVLLCKGMTQSLPYSYIILRFQALLRSDRIVSRYHPVQRSALVRPSEVGPQTANQVFGRPPLGGGELEVPQYSASTPSSGDRYQN